MTMGVSSFRMVRFNTNALVLAVMIISSENLMVVSQGALKIGFYSQLCPNAESIVRSVVRQRVLTEPAMAAVLLRLHFHDCFVQGCDGSILISNGEKAERNAFGHQGVGGFDLIDKAKAQLEAVCPGVVSCADIVALAARDAVALSNGPSYQVLTGRRDGRISDESLADDMPDVSDSIMVLKDKFAKKGLTPKDLVLLSAAHSIGTTACFFMETRLYQFNSGTGSDPEINPQFLPKLKSLCPRGGDSGKRIDLDMSTNHILDDQILRNIKTGFAVLESDARLYDDKATKQVVDSYIMGPSQRVSFNVDFASSIVKMGQIGVKVGLEGEIRRVCSAFN